MRDKLILTIILLAIPCVLLLAIHPWTGTMFQFHDQTQPARIQQFVQEVQSGHIPPRIAPDFSFGMGYPVFAFYAPFSYWVTALPVLMGLAIVPALKGSFITAVIIAFIGMYVFQRQFYGRCASITGATVFITIPYLAGNIVVRGNLAEVWYLGLLPWVLYLLLLSTQVPKKRWILASILSMSALFTVHNIFSLISLPLLLVYCLLLPQKKRSIMMLIAALTLSASFLLPAVLESGRTYAAEVAAQTRYRDHFLCLWQLWDSPWGYGGSAPGCTDDGFSFKLGKLQIIMGGLGMAMFLVSLPTRQKGSLSAQEKVLMLLFLITIGSVFLTLSQSQLLWSIFEPVMSIFQFPWRFLIFVMVGLSFFTGYLVHRLPVIWKHIPATGIVILLVMVNQKYFSPYVISESEFTTAYLSKQYIEEEVAFHIPEYFPRTGSHGVWRSYYGNAEQITQLRSEIRTLVTPSSPATVVEHADGSVTVQPGRYTINIHSFPNRLVLVNGNVIPNQRFDSLGRPQFQVSTESTIQVIYQQTSLQSLGNAITLITFFILMAFIFKDRFKDFKEI